MDAKNYTHMTSTDRGQCFEY